MDSSDQPPIEQIILTHSLRGIETLVDIINPGYCRRAADLIIQNKGTVLIGTGFPVKGSFESDGPIGAIALYQVLEHLGYRPVFVCAPPIAGLLKSAFETCEIPILSWEESIPVVEAALAELRPDLVVSVERPGIAEDGCYYNMRQEEITDFAAKYDLFFHLADCPTLAFGDGGNEIGMGNVADELGRLPIIPSVTPCDELVISTVSNWGVYGVIAEMSLALETDLFTLFDGVKIAHFLAKNGSLDGVTARPEISEDGFPIAVGQSIIGKLREVVFESIPAQEAAGA